MDTLNCQYVFTPRGGRKLKRVLTVLVIVIVLISGLTIYYVVRRYMFLREEGVGRGREGEMPRLVGVPEIYDLGAFVYPGEEVSVESPLAPQYNLPLNPKEVVNWDEVPDKVKDVVMRNGFAVLPGRVKEIAEFYKQVSKHRRPVFITTDSVLYVYHAFFDTILMQLEEKRFIPTLKALLNALIKKSEALWESLPENTPAKEAAKRDVAYLSVALKLLDPSFQPPSFVNDLVESELALIMSASNPRTKSPIFGYEEDYTQYAPRGHYTTSEPLKRYFRCMMWLGRMRFEVKDPVNPELAKLQTRQALLLSYLMATVEINGSKALNVWERIYYPTAFIVGESDDLTFYDYLKVIAQVYGEFSPKDVNDDEKLDEFREKVAELDKSKIMASPVFPYEKSRLPGLRFMGQRFILDGYIHQRLCYPNLPTRFRVSGLDIAAALGSDRALEHLEEEFEKHPGFKEELLKIRNEVSKIPTEEWTRTLYMGWLYTLRTLLRQPVEGYPTFMRTEAWLDKSLNTMLASWAQLRHDTILYAKQPYAGLTAIPPRPSHVGYVEPNPELYSRLRNLVEATRAGLRTMGVLSQEIDSKLETFSKVLGMLTDISVKELKGEPLTEEEKSFIKSYGQYLEELLSVGKPQTKDPRVIADVFTEPNTNTVLEVGTGYFDMIVVVYKTPSGELYAGEGLVMSYYEFYWPQTDRLTDEKWRDLLDSGKAPPQLSWIHNFKISGS